MYLQEKKGILYYAQLVKNDIRDILPVSMFNGNGIVAFVFCHLSSVFSKFYAGIHLRNKVFKPKKPNTVITEFSETQNQIKNQNKRTPFNQTKECENTFGLTKTVLAYYYDLHKKTHIVASGDTLGPRRCHERHVPVRTL